LTAVEAERALLAAAFELLRSKGSHRIYGKGRVEGYGSFSQRRSSSPEKSSNRSSKPLKTLPETPLLSRKAGTHFGPPIPPRWLDDSDLSQSGLESDLTRASAITGLGHRTAPYPSRQPVVEEVTKIFELF
jgi:hypothetical protein